ncbi:hypothetical protein [Providencia rettgeri]|uniref:Uncharacterized protein n=1 Tax=Providencia rettgeri TaxID=587 RepID=A0A379FTD9_PRORE|nr:hypothetical protein [Providencia rettgeri]QXB04782.1 hypothetical protein I6L80_15545 [Providencia rettgeri]SUC32084.1 Uncharacterised protein [Providencia rettgeri]
MKMVIFGRMPFIIKLVIFTLVLLMLLDMVQFSDVLLNTWKNIREYLNDTVLV